MFSYRIMIGQNKKIKTTFANFLSTKSQNTVKIQFKRQIALKKHLWIFSKILQNTTYCRKQVTYRKR